MNRESIINLLDFLPDTAIQIDMQSKTKKEVLKELTTLLVDAHGIKGSQNNILDALMEREDMGSTGIGQGIAIPHGKSESVKEVVAGLGISKKGIDFDALDGEPVYLFFIVVAPLNASGVHLKILAKISRLLKDKFFRQALREAKASEDVRKVIKQENAY